MATRDRTVVFVSTFAACLARAYDHIRMGAVCHTNINFFGSHCGISIGKWVVTLRPGGGYCSSGPSKLRPAKI